MNIESSNKKNFKSARIIAMIVFGLPGLLVARKSFSTMIAFPEDLGQFLLAGVIAIIVTAIMDFILWKSQGVKSFILRIIGCLLIFVLGAMVYLFVALQGLS